MKCIYLKQKVNKKVVCRLDEKKNVPQACANCTAKEFECTINSNLLCKNALSSKTKYSSNRSQKEKGPLKTVVFARKPDYLKKKSNKLAKLERNRSSLFTNDLEHCIICGKKKEHLHEVFSGTFRQRSMTEQMILPLCFFHHTKIHEDIELNLYWKRLCQQRFEEIHTREEFIKIFGRSYL